MKKISVVIACYNEENNVIPMAETLVKHFTERLPEYDYEIIFVDNDSTDATRGHILKLCQENSKIKAIFNSRNFGSIRSSINGLLYATGDCVVKMCADFQDPPELIEDFVRKWEEGNKIVLAIKSASQENKLMYMVRKAYYKLVKKITDINHIENFVGYGLYDRAFIEIIRDLKDPMPYFRGIVAEMGYKYAVVPYVQPQRKSGKSKFNFYRLYDYAMLGITAYSKIPLRIMTFIGGIFSFLSIIAALVYLVYKLCFWDSFNVGMAPLVIGIYFLGSLQLLFLGIIGEYILNINMRVLNRPLVTIEKLVNFEEEKQGEEDV